MTSTLLHSRLCPHRPSHFSGSTTTTHPCKITMRISGSCSARWTERRSALRTRAQAAAIETISSTLVAAKPVQSPEQPLRPPSPAPSEELSATELQNGTLQPTEADVTADSAATSSNSKIHASVSTGFRRDHGSQDQLEPKQHKPRCWYRPGDIVAGRVVSVGAQGAKVQLFQDDKYASSSGYVIHFCSAFSRCLMTNASFNAHQVWTAAQD